MKQAFFLLMIIFGSLCTGITTATPVPGKANALSAARSLQFIENKGQIVDQYHNPRPDIDFKLSAGNGLNIFIGPGKIHYQWSRTTPGASSHTGSEDEKQVETTMYRMDVTLLQANPQATAVTEQQQPYYEQLYLTHTGPDGATAHAFRKLTYREVYPHIDWVLYINDEGRLEHDFIIHPGGEVSDIQLEYAGATNIELHADGSAMASTPFGTVKENAPYCFQQDGKQIAGKFILENNKLRFSIAPYQGILTIDPVLEWGTYFGGSGTHDMADAVTGDLTGNIYLTGFTLSTDNIATTGAFQFTYGGSNIANNLGDAFLAKFTCEGKCAWATYYGGAAGERGRAVSCDPAGNIYIAGFVNSNGGNPSLNLATPGSHQDAFGGGGGDLFLVKFDAQGQRRWATYYGGSGNEATTDDFGVSGFLPLSVTCDKQGNVYLAGSTSSSNGIASSNGFQQTFSGSMDAFLVQFDSTGTRHWATYYGGTGDDRGNTICCDGGGHIYLAGTTSSGSGISTSTAHQQANNGGASDAFLVKFSSTGQQQWATYYGGSNTDEGHSVSCDTAGSIFLAGRTKSSNGIASPGSFQGTNKGGLWDAFLVKFDATGSREWGTFYGGINQAAVFGFSCIAADLAGNVYMGGIANGLDSLATPGSFQEQVGGGTDGFLAKFDKSGSRVWCTYYGGSGADMVNSTYVSRQGEIYIAGYTASTTSISTASGYQTTPGGGTNNGFLVKFREDENIPPPDTIWGAAIVCAVSTQTYAVPAMPGALSYTWVLPPGWTGSSATDSIIVVVGTHTDTLWVTANFSCGSSAEAALVITVIPEAAITTDMQVRCAGDTVLLRSSIMAGMSWQWLRNGAFISGETDSVLLTLQSGDYRVITITAQCMDTSDAVTVHALPRPVVTQSGNVLTTDAHYVSYQWYYGSQTITGATQPVYTYAAEGAYRVSVTDTNGCSGMSELFAPVHIASVTAKDAIRVYPNPVQSVIHVVAAGSVLITISTIDGREVLRAEQQNHIDVSTLADGLYLLQVMDSKGRTMHMEKMVKARF